MGKAKQWIVTANFTADGSVAYLGADGEFGGRLTQAKIFDDKAEAEAARVAAAHLERFVSDPYLTEVGVAPQGLDALTARERIRALGPTVRIRRPDPTHPSVSGR